MIPGYPCAMRTALFACALVGCGALCGLVACSSDDSGSADSGSDTTTDVGSSNESGRDAAGDSTTDSAEEPTGDDSSVGDSGDGSASEAAGEAGDDASFDGGVADSGADAGDASADAPCLPLTKLFPPPDAGPTIYCPFSAVDGGGNKSCTAVTQHCCEALGTSSCDPIANACPATDTDWQCQDPIADCPNAQAPVCCAVGATLVASIDPNCGNYATGFQGAACVPTGGCANGITMCTSDLECPNNQTCTPFGAQGAQVGGCH
jgi:hypothetical protein